MVVPQTLLKIDGIIILENPPYADTGDTSNISNKKGKTNSWVKEQGKIKGINGNSLNELSNQINIDYLKTYFFLFLLFLE